MGDVGLDQSTVVVEDPAQRLGPLGRRGREHGSQVAGRRPRQDGVCLDTDQIVGHQVHHGVAGRAECLRVHVAQPRTLGLVEDRQDGVQPRGIIWRDHRLKSTGGPAHGLSAYPAPVLRIALSTVLVLNGLLLLAGWWRLRSMPDAAPHTGPLKALLGLAIVTLLGAVAIFLFIPG